VWRYLGGCVRWLQRRIGDAGLRVTLFPFFHVALLLFLPLATRRWLFVPVESSWNLFHDQFTTPQCSFHTFEELRGWAREAGLDCEEERREAAHQLATVRLAIGGARIPASAMVGADRLHRGRSRTAVSEERLSRIKNHSVTTTAPGAVARRLRRRLDESIERITEFCLLLPLRLLARAPPLGDEVFSIATSSADAEQPAYSLFSERRSNSPWRASISVHRPPSGSS
jgi:hypothetical protein